MSETSSQAKGWQTAGSDMELATSRSSWKERKGNALASGADEGRDKLRKASGRSKYPLIGDLRMGNRRRNTPSSRVEQNRRGKGTPLN